MGDAVASADNLELNVYEDQNKAVLEVLDHRLRRDELDAFQDGCDRLLASGMGELVIEARKVWSMSSALIGVLIEAGAKAKDSGQHLVMDTTQGMSDILQRMVADLVEIVVIPDEDPAGAPE